MRLCTMEDVKAHLGATVEFDWVMRGIPTKDNLNPGWWTEEDIVAAGLRWTPGYCYRGVINHAGDREYYLANVVMLFGDRPCGIEMTGMTLWHKKQIALMNMVVVEKQSQK